ncbi:MAG: phytoene desaturase family protein, partial [Planctomycetota bacterium]
IAEELGVKFRYDEPVTEVKMEGRRVVGLTTEQGTYDADAFVVNADFADWMTRVVPNAKRRRWTDESIEKKRFSCSTFMLYLGVEGVYEQLPHHSIHISEDYDQNLREIETEHKLSQDPSFYVQNACVTDPSLAPEGNSTLYVLVPVTHLTGAIDWQAEAPRFRELTLDKLSAIGLDDIRDRIRYEHMLTPQSWSDDYAIYRGATFNLAHNLGQMLHNRPRNRFEDLDGVYLVGGGTHPGSGLPVIYESSRITTRLMQKDLGLTGSSPSVAQSVAQVAAL